MAEPFDPTTLLAARTGAVAPSFIRNILRVASAPEIISFAGGLPNQALFPDAALRRASAAVFDQFGPGALQYAESQGYGPLREWIAARYRERHGLDIDPDAVFITSGSQQALDLLGKVLLDEGDGVVLEAPGYLGAIQAFSLYRPRWLPVPLHDDGLDTDGLDRALTAAPKLLYTVPEFQNPTGISYSEANRRTVAEALDGRPLVVVEDNPYGELRFSGKPHTPFHALLPQQCVLLGSFSKTVAPALRLGWMVAPPWLREKLLVAKQATDLHSNHFSQLLLHRFLADNDLDAHLARIGTAYAAQKQAMVAAIGRHFPAAVRTTDPAGGMFLWADLPESLSASALFEQALAERVAFVPGHPFFVDRTDSHSLRLNFTSADAETIPEGIERLGRVIDRALDGPERANGAAGVL